MPVQIGQSEPGFDDPVGLMAACHRRIERFLAVLVDLTIRRGGNGLNRQEKAAMETALRYFRHAAPHHTADEEDGLFLALEKDRADDDGMISELERDHRRIEGLHKTIDGLGVLWLTAGNLAESKVIRLQAVVGELSALYQDHIRVEEQHIFPRARTSLSREALEVIGRGMAVRRGLSYIPTVVVAAAGSSCSSPIRPAGLVDVLQQQDKED